MTPAEMQEATATFIATHRLYQAELQARCDEAEAKLAAMRHDAVKANNHEGANMENFEATVDVHFQDKNGQTWHGVTVHDGSLSKGDAVGITPPGANVVYIDAEVLEIRRNGQAVERIEVDGQVEYRCSLLLSGYPADAKVGAHLGMTFIENAKMYGLAEDDFI